MNEQKEVWKKQVLDSLEGMERATPNPFLLAKIRERIKSPENVVPAMRPSILGWSFACLAALFVLNISVLIIILRTENSRTGADYSPNSFSKNFNLYEE